MERSCKIHHNHFLNPDVNCYNMNHIECNDPIFRFFEYAKLADRKAKTNLDYQKEYEKIAKHCRELSADLLTKCNKTSEIEQVLDEVSGSSNYFRYYNEIQKHLIPALHLFYTWPTSRLDPPPDKSLKNPILMFLIQLPPRNHRQKLQ